MRMDDNCIVKNILKEYKIDGYGFADFQSVQPLLECRARERLPKDAKTVIVCAFPYWVGELPKRNISRYAAVQDYHDVLKTKLETVCMCLAEAYPQNTFAYFVDNSPIREVEAAVQAGLGVKGKNGLLLHPLYGSYLFLGEIVTDLALMTSKKQEACIGCGACVKACPADAITEKGVKQECCLSHITQKRGELTKEEADLVQKGKLLWGCDICQDVCPYNRHLPLTGISEFRQDIISEVMFDQIDALVKTRAFGFRGPKVLKRNYHILYGEKE